MTDDERAPLLGGRYELGPTIGQGGMGRVFRARDLRLSRDVAVKMLTFGARADRSARERLEHEALTSARINHPNVVAVYDVGEHDGELFIVMECLPGRTLADQLRTERVPAEHVLTLTRELLAGLAAAHARGVLHRDIKPDNVLFAADGSAKLGDFGIAKMADSADLTATGTVIGTARYLPPERLRGLPATTAGDQYSLAVVLYEALTGHRPFAGDAPVAVAHAIASTTPAPIAELVPDADPVLAAAIERAMQRDPADRFSSVSSFADAVASDAILPTTAPDRSVATAVLDIPLPAQALPTQTLPTQTLTRYADAADPTHNRSRIGATVLAGLAVLVLIAGVAFGLHGHGSGVPPVTTRRPAAATTAGVASTTMTPATTTTAPPSTTRPTTGKGHGPPHKPKGKGKG